MAGERGNESPVGGFWGERAGQIRGPLFRKGGGLPEAWAGTFFVINLIYIPLLEEPMLEARFGESYRTYKQHVRMFVPRLDPWSG